MTNALATWFANNLGNIMPAELVVFIVSLFPILECRGGMIVAGLRHVPAWQAFIICYIGNILPIPFILLSAALAMILCPFCYVALFGARKRLSIRDMQNGNRFNFSSKDKNVILEEMLTDMLEEADKGTLTRIQAKYGVELNVPMEQEEKKREKEESRM